MTSQHGLRRLGRVALCALALARGAYAQDVRIRDLVLSDAAPSVRLMGYGLVTGLSGTGDRVMGTTGSTQTVQSIVNLLRRFDIGVPAELLSTRNVAAVLVTAEVSPYLRPGGRFEVRVSSLGDALSLHGGVLWMTPLVAEAGGKPYAGAQGALMVSGAENARSVISRGNTAQIPDGGVLEVDLPRTAPSASGKLLLREPDMTTATRIAAVIDSALGSPGQATVDDPGAITLALKDTAKSVASALARIADLKVRRGRAARIIIDGLDGTIVAGGELLVGEAMVSHAGITLTIGTAADTTSVRGDVRVAAGTSVQQIAVALHAMQTRPGEMAAIFEALREIGAISAEVSIR